MLVLVSESQFTDRAAAAQAGKRDHLRHTAPENATRTLKALVLFSVL